METKITLSDFTFMFVGYGHYKVTYTSPVTGKSWKTITANMRLIDATKNADYTKIKDLNRLKSICKS